MTLETTIVRRNDFRDDSVLRRKILSLIQPSYACLGTLLDREYAYCDTVFLDWNDEEQSLNGFFMVGWNTLRLGNRNCQLAYLGLSGSKAELKNSGRIHRLYEAFNTDAVETQDRSGEQVVYWFTTASPSAYHAGEAVFMNPDPRQDGSFSEAAAEVVSAIRGQRGWGESTGHPFVAKGVAGDTRYSDSEDQRIAGICKKTGFSLFNDLGIDEHRGDRLIVICHPRGGSVGLPHKS